MAHKKVTIAAYGSAHSESGLNFKGKKFTYRYAYARAYNVLEISIKYKRSRAIY